MGTRGNIVKLRVCPRVGSAQELESSSPRHNLRAPQPLFPRTEIALVKTKAKTSQTAVDAVRDHGFWVVRWR